MNNKITVDNIENKRWLYYNNGQEDLARGIIMKTKSRAFTVLKRKSKESWACLLTLTLSASLLLVFINIQTDTNFLAQVTTIKDPIMKFTSSLALGGITLIIAGVCAINCYVANMYFLKAKAQELCVYLSCGMNIVGLAKYLIAQNVMLLLVALPIGIILAIFMNPLVNLVMYHVLDITGNLFTISWKGMFAWLFIQFIEIIYLFLINIGYAYKAELKDLLDERSIVHLPDMRMIKLPAVLYPSLCLLSFIAVVIFPVDATYYSICVVIAFLGVKGSFLYYLPSRRNHRILQRNKLQYEKTILSGNVHALLKSCYMYILMIFLLVVSMTCIMVDGLLMPYVRVILLLAYILLLTLLGASLFFKIMLEANKRKQDVLQLVLMGLPMEKVIVIIRKEILCVFTYCIVIPLPFASFICFRYIANNRFSMTMGGFLIFSYIFMLCMTAMLSYKCYQKNVIGGKQCGQSN